METPEMSVNQKANVSNAEQPNYSHVRNVSTPELPIAKKAKVSEARSNLSSFNTEILYYKNNEEILNYKDKINEIKYVSVIRLKSNVCVSDEMPELVDS